MHFVQYLVAFCGRQEAASDVIADVIVELIFADKFLKFRDPRLNLSEEIRPKAIGCGIFGLR